METNAVDGGAAILRLRSQDTRCTFTLVPMIEGGQAYGKVVLRELARQDLILFDTGDSPLQDAGGGPVPPRMELLTQRVTVRDARERDGISAPRESPAEFGRWWQGFPAGGGDGVSVPLFRSVVIAMARGSQTVENDFSWREGARLREVVLEPADRSIGSTVDRLYEAVRSRPVFVGIFLESLQLKEAAQHLRERYEFRIVERNSLPLAGPPLLKNQSSVRVSAQVGRHLMEQLAGRRHRAAILAGFWKLVRLGLLIALAAIAIGAAYFLVTHWSVINDM